MQPHCAKTTVKKLVTFNSKKLPFCAIGLLQQAHHGGNDAVLGWIFIQLIGALGRLEQPHVFKVRVVQDVLVEGAPIKVVVARQTAQVDTDVVLSRADGDVLE